MVEDFRLWNNQKHQGTLMVENLKRIEIVKLKNNINESSPLISMRLNLDGLINQT